MSRLNMFWYTWNLGVTKLKAQTLIDSGWIDEELLKLKLINFGCKDRELLSLTGVNLVDGAINWMYSYFLDLGFSRREITSELITGWLRTTQQTDAEVRQGVLDERNARMATTGRWFKS